MSKERRLGRGLEALLGRGPQTNENQTAGNPAAVEEKKSAPDIIPMSTVQKPAATNNEAQKPMPQAASDRGAGVEKDEAAKPATVASGSLSGIGRSGILKPAGGTTTAEVSSKIAGSQNQTLNEGAVEKSDGESKDNDLVQVNVALIETNPFQPRKQFDDASMAELAESISAHGLLQPIVARRVDDVYQLIAGERRLRAAQKAGWEEVPVRVIETDERGAAELAIVENLQRQDLSPLEKAASFKRYLKEHRCTQGQLANRLKIDRSTIANLMRLLELPEEVQSAISGGKISQGHARALLPLGEEREQIAFCKRIEREGLSVRKTETLVQEAIRAADAEPLSVVGRDGSVSKSNKNEHLDSLEQEFRLALGTKVKIAQGKGGSGKLTIQFKNHDEFNRIKAHIMGTEKSQSKAG